MINQEQYVIWSLELHIFFGRIMKEHSFFLEAGFTPANPNFSKVADQYKEQFEIVLNNAVILGNGVISPDVVNSGEIVTDYTLRSEQMTENFTGIDINKSITRLEREFQGSMNPMISPSLVAQVKKLNTQTIPLLEGLIDFKTQVLNNVLSCKMFTVNYPLLIEHILREAKMYLSHICSLENGESIDDNIKDIELFWDQIMLEHALFIRGLLDPTENDLINTSNDFAQDYADLLQSARNATDMTIEGITDVTLAQTMKYRDFKAAGTEGIAECKIRSIILPLLGDHVLREANHFIRLLQQFR
ncbi:MAG: DUF2935 domain-containing protein [Candidatus Galacturonibacter soehngenii]|nr:DUF2935 domain-containing protein [Candidatus Galacturonibacter soehngenii]